MIHKNMEKFTQPENILSSRTEKEASFKARLNEIVSLPYGERGFQSWMSDILTHEGGDEEIENFFKNVSKSEFLRDTVQKNINIFVMLFHEVSKKIFDKPEDIESLVHNLKERQEEISRNGKDRYRRILSNPYASDEEYRAGTYKESIESQVRDAVFELRKKGYSTMESGFRDLVTGSQYIGINREVGIDSQTITESINKNLNKENKLILSKILVKNSDNRVQIVLFPKIRTMPLNVWKLVWDDVASCIPVIDDSLRKKENSDNGEQGRDFREAQDKIKEGKNTLLNSGLAFVDGKVVHASYQDFMNLRNSQR